MSRLHGQYENIAAIRARLSVIPTASVIAGSLVVGVLPIVGTAPLLPPLAFMIFLGWRLLRPEIWPLWAGLPFGLFDDLMTGNPIGSGMILWTLLLLVFDVAENRMIWRDYWFDWLVATGAVVFYILGTMLLSAFTGGGAVFAPALPQIAISILLVPVVFRLCARLDRWRLSL